MVRGRSAAFGTAPVRSARQGHDNLRKSEKKLRETFDQLTSRVGKIHSQRSEIDSFIVMDVMQRAAEKEAAGVNVIHMEVGQPATPAPLFVRQAVGESLSGPDAMGYTVALGRPALRERISQHYTETYGVKVDPGRILITTGSSAGFVLTFLSLFDVGARVALPSPGYPCYRQILKALGQEPVVFETSADTRWMPTPEQIERLAKQKKIDGLLIASPNNPTGTVLDGARLAAIADVCSRHGIRFISDEIYHGLTYGARAQTLLAHSDDGVVINSFSKYFSMTGWRIGWIVVPKNLVRTFERLAQNFYISAPTVSQVAAQAAFDSTDELEKNVAVYRDNRRLLLEGLPNAGFDKIVPADGAFYLYCDVGDQCDDSLAYANRILDETGVAVTPGIDFDAKRGHNFIRFSYAGDTASMREAVERLQAWRRLR